MNYNKLALELANWALECAERGRDQWSPQEDIEALVRESGSSWIVRFCDGSHEYEIGLGSVAFMGNKSARLDQILEVYPNNK